MQVPDLVEAHKQEKREASGLCNFLLSPAPVTEILIILILCLPGSSTAVNTFNLRIVIDSK